MRNTHDEYTGDLAHDIPLAEARIRERKARLEHQRTFAEQAVLDFAEAGLAACIMLVILFTVLAMVR